MSQSKRRPTVDLGYPTEAHGRIPSFASLEEEAAFWDTHDFTDFADESVPVQIAVGQELAERLTLRLDQADRQELARRAKAKGIGPSPGCGSRSACARNVKQTRRSLGRSRIQWQAATPS